MIPQFPSFKKLTPDDRQEIEQISHEHEPYSDFNFSSLWSYNTEEDIEISRLNDNIVIRFQDYLTHQKFYSFIGKNKVFETIHFLLQKTKTDENVLDHLKLIPESAVTSLEQSDGFTLQEDRDNFDYILDIDKLFDTTIGTYSHKRRLAKRFDRENPNAYISILNINDREVHEQLLNCFHRWEIKRQKTGDETAQELTAIKRTLIKTDDHNAQALGIIDSGQIIGFTLFEEVHRNHGIIHFCKFDPTYKGIVEKLIFETAQILKNKGCKYLNIEQDLGIEGLRNSKNLWYPSHFLKKYTITSN